MKIKKIKKIFTVLINSLFQEPNYFANGKENVVVIHFTFSDDNFYPDVEDFTRILPEWKIDMAEFMDRIAETYINSGVKEEGIKRFITILENAISILNREIEARRRSNDG